MRYLFYFDIEYAKLNKKTLLNRLTYALVFLVIKYLKL